MHYDVSGWKGGRWRGERIPSLAEVLAMVPDGKLAFLEFKTGPEIVGPLADELAGAAIDGQQIVLMSFDAEVVRACKQRLPEIMAFWLADYKQQPDGG